MVGRFERAPRRRDSGRLRGFLRYFLEGAVDCVLPGGPAKVAQREKTRREKVVVFLGAGRR